MVKQSGCVDDTWGKIGAELVVFQSQALGHEPKRPKMEERPPPQAIRCGVGLGRRPKKVAMIEIWAIMSQTTCPPIGIYSHQTRHDFTCKTWGIQPADLGI